MADYDTHANKARELLAGMKFSRAHSEWGIAAAQVEALLALAAAIADQRTDRDIR
ncbi:hypothetical protein [Streptomyces sp. H39-S7]|uniref:hypothetical protein n=1 Tax=Streptomyces sp. H39-S7 TaxID=3004357 RepID=UPI0022AF106F|nr:hypothetical protein [Streptomyces sp. H39-S7]MCZ4118989.1 hypothetical protein [Streptomyces sp. H39-S7]